MNKIFTAVMIMLLSNLALAESYYDQFLYVGQCPKSVETKAFKALHSESGIMSVIDVVDKDDSKKIIYITISLQLFADGTYFARYDEFIAASSVAGFSDPNMQKDLVGKWSVSGHRILIDGIGYGVPWEIQPLPGPKGIKLIITNSIINPRAVNTKIILSYGATNMGPHYACN